MLISKCCNKILNDADFKYSAYAFKYCEMEVRRIYTCSNCFKECETEEVDDSKVFNGKTFTKSDVIPKL